MPSLVRIYHTNQMEGERFCLDTSCQEQRCSVGVLVQSASKPISTWKLDVFLPLKKLRGIKCGMASWTLAALCSPQLNFVSLCYTPCRQVSTCLCVHFLMRSYVLYMYYIFHSFFFKKQMFLNPCYAKEKTENMNAPPMNASCCAIFVFPLQSFGKRSIYT